MVKNELGLSVAEEVKKRLIRIMSKQFETIWCASAQMGYLSTFRFTDQTMTRFAWVTQDSVVGNIIVWFAKLADNSVVYEGSHQIPTPRLHHETFPQISKRWGYADNFNFETSKEAAHAIQLFMVKDIKPQRQLTF